MNGQSMGAISPYYDDSGFLTAMNCMQFVTASGNYQLINCCGTAAASQLPPSPTGTPARRPVIPDIELSTILIQQRIPQQPWFGLVRDMMPPELQYQLPGMYA